MARSDPPERGSWGRRAGPILLVLAAGLGAALTGRGLGLAAPPLDTGATSRASSWHVLVADRAEPALYAPRGIAVDGQGRVHVLDQGDHRVKVFSSHGQLRAVWGTDTAGPLHMQDPDAIAVDRQGMVYVADSGILKLSPTGRVLARWGGHGEPPNPVALAVGGRGNLFLLIRGTWGTNGGCGTSRVVKLSSRVLKLSPSGVVVARWGPRIGNIRVSQPSGVVVDGRGNIYLAGDFYRRDSAGSASEECVEKLSPAGAPLASWGRRQFGVAAWQTGPGCGGQIAVDSRGNVYTEFIGVAATSATGKPLGRWDVAGQAPGQFSGLTSIAIDARDNLYAADPGNYRIQKLSVAH